MAATKSSPFKDERGLRANKLHVDKRQDGILLVR